MVSQPLIVPDTGTASTPAQERLSDVEMAYHRQVMAQVRLLASIEQQIAQLQAQRQAIVGVRDSWMQFQKDARGLDDGDVIDGDGYVVRMAAGGVTMPDQEDA